MKKNSPTLETLNMTSVYKKDPRNDGTNYKVYENCMFDEMTEYFNDILSNYQFGFKKGFSSKHCLLILLEKCKKIRYKGGSFWALLTDLSKALDCLLDDLLVAKLHAYGFDMTFLKLVSSYLSNRKQKVKINDKFSSWEEIVSGVPVESILESLLFDTFLCDLIIFTNDTDIANYADVNTTYTSESTTYGIVERLEEC